MVRLGQVVDIAEHLGALQDGAMEEPPGELGGAEHADAGAPADSPKMVTLPGSPPKAEMFLLTH